MIGDSEPFETEGGGGLGHSLEGVLAIAGDGVIVETSSDLSAGEEVGQLVFFGGGNFSTVFAEFGGNKSEAESAVEVFFFFEFEGGFRFSLEEAPFAEVKTLIDGALAEGDIMLLGSSEVGEGCGPGFGGNDAEVAGDAPSKDDTGFGFALGDDFLDRRGGDECLHDFLGLGGGGDEIEIFDNFFASAEAAGDLCLLDVWALAEVGEKSLSDGQGIAEAMELLVGGAAGDGFEKVGGGFFSQTCNRGEATIGASGGESFDRFDVELIA